MKKLVVVVVVLALAMLWWAQRDGGSGKKPDAKLARHITAVCRIFEKNVDSPRSGVDRLFGYLGKHTEEIFGLFGATLVVIEKIPDDKQHDQRAREAAKRLHPPLIACDRPANRFFDAVNRDPEARKRFEHGVQRLDRTLQILFGEESAARVKALVVGRVP